MYNHDKIILPTGVGGFTESGAYAFDKLPALPHSNVIAYGDFGTLVTDTGGGFTWHKNARENKLTVWRADAARDVPSESFTLQKTGAKSGRPFPIALPLEPDRYARRVLHGLGRSVFFCDAGDAEFTMKIYIDRSAEVKYYDIEARGKRASAFALRARIEPVLGDFEAYTARYIFTAREGGVISARNIAGGAALYFTLPDGLDWKKAGNGERGKPNAGNGERGSENDGAKIAYRATFAVKPGETKRFIFTLSPHKPDSAQCTVHSPQLKDNAECNGHFSLSKPVTDCPSKENSPTKKEKSVGKLFSGNNSQLPDEKNPDNTSQFSILNSQLKEPDRNFQLSTFNFQFADAALQDCSAYFSNLSKLKIKTPDPAFDALFRWLPYQTLSGRFYGRAGYYQAGGAYGFRDQLQDCLALLYVDPALVRNHILLCARRQFKEGDAQHWWHEGGAGVRTRVSDDFLFLPYVVAEYIGFTGDRAVLDAEEPFLDAPELPEGARGDYSTPPYAPAAAPLYEHCLRALRRALKFGERGLNLIGGGDWNDAFDEIGLAGRGESVWLTEFYIMAIAKFLPYVKGAKARRELSDLKAILKKNVLEKCWDGRWFTRAYWDDGTPVGSKTCAEGKIDLLAGSFAVLSGIAEGELAEQVLAAMREYLVDTQNGVIKLLTPPFTAAGKRAGYVNDYPPGARENGGQYTHAAVWYIMALLKAGKKEDAYQMLSMVNPVNRGKDPAYRGEPYVTAADVYASKGLEGRAGWTWYTGGAAWMYKLMAEGVLGIKIEGSRLSVKPNA
ncbi:MAG: hypothetical protein LBL66_00980, partial [Clostridiales bacterium]|nr:hypothetical protein [Clostridiales bacterium]